MDPACTTTIMKVRRNCIILIFPLLSLSLVCPLLRVEMYQANYNIFPNNFTDDEPEELDSDDEYYGNHIDTTKVDEIPAREPKFNAVPLKSALKKKTSNPGTPTQDNRTLVERQPNSSFK
jgi:hypothetical protein